MVNGKYRGESAVLLALHIDQFCADVKLKSGRMRGEVLKKIEYEDICKLAQ